MAIARSPNNATLRATFQNSKDESFQDEVMNSLQHIAAVVPDGMLVFMPSYGFMNTLVQRWKRTRMPLCDWLLCISNMHSRATAVLWQPRVCG
jgi:Rad3-related DNA helicase